MGYGHLDHKHMDACAGMWLLDLVGCYVKTSFIYLPIGYLLKRCFALYIMRCISTLVSKKVKQDNVDD